MDVPETKLQPPDEFLFPFNPYSIQTDFMKNLYHALEMKKLGVFESPTGTGKSMSIICGSLSWLFDHENRVKTDISNKIMCIEENLKELSTSDNWLDSYHIESKRKQKKIELEKFLNKLKVNEEKIHKVINNATIKKKEKVIPKKVTKNTVKKIQKTGKEEPEDGNCLDDFLLDDMKQAEYSSDSENEEKVTEDKIDCTKIFLCSRTHSQLTQLAGEVRKSPFRDMGVRVVPLASRQNLCVNDSVLGLKSLSLINEACQDLRARKSSKTTKSSNKGEKLKKLKTSGGCCYTSENNMEQLRGECLSEIHDLEELVETGRTVVACPYYTSRNCIPDAHIVLVPYNTILHKSTRDASGIDVRGSVVIVDEAHNLVDTLGNIHSASVSGLQLCHTHSFLVQYRDKFRDRFTPKNLLNLNQLIFVVNKLMRLITPKEVPEISTNICRLSNFLITAEIDNINIYTLLEFCSKSHLVNKLKGYVDKFQPAVVLQEKKAVPSGVSTFLKSMANKNLPNSNPSPPESEPVVYSGNPALSVLSFLNTLTNHCEDGRIVTKVAKTPANASLKFLLLNPAAHFSDIVTQARSVILAGGTMQPFSEFTEQLFLLTGATPSRIHTFSCGHVVPPSNILPLTIAQGPSGKTLLFNFANRKNIELLDELGRLLTNVCSVIPAGVVIFFVSYEYEDLVFQHLTRTGVISKLENKKKVMREPKESNKVERVLSQYAEAAPKGALLFSVVGGKLSEGLNFNDDLGRCVIVVGLPYPNKTSPELNEKMHYLEEKIGSGAGSIYYENLCMKAVNQSIGRSVRHLNDYAAVLLVDQRYGRSNIQAALPQWIRNSLSIQPIFRPVQGLLAKFFASKKNNVIPTI